MANILICDDDVDIVSALKIYLSNEDYKIYTAFTGKQALDCVREHDIDLVLMDVMMPEMDGIEATAKLREEYNIPVILLTAKSESSDKVLGLNVGADDYVTKPFDPVEVQARVRSQLRRYTRLGGQVKREQPKDTITIGGVELNDAEKSVTVDGEPVQLTPIEYNILKLLMRNPNRVFSSTQIYELVWNENAYGSESAVAVHIRHLREKIEINPSDPRYIKVVWGQGYKMEGKK
ncbi:MAG TPA: response regulator transcription factor [Candidatus Scatomorpha merdavium]|jgi:DNA-binding response OmpR family regulator|nr:response regulator transcription factor [Candidatus Scatomorpha merdavium]